MSCLRSAAEVLPKQGEYLSEEVNTAKYHSLAVALLVGLPLSSRSMNSPHELAVVEEEEETKSKRKSATVLLYHLFSYLP